MDLYLTGGTGFIGKHLLKSDAFNDFNVTLLVRKEPPPDLIAYPYILIGDFLSKNFEHFSGLFLHAATDYGRQGNIADIINTNLTLPMYIVEKLQKNLMGFVYLDTYYNKVNYQYPHLLNYSISKMFFHNWSKLAFPNLSQKRLILEHVYGPDDRLDKFVPNLIQKARLNQDMELSSGHQIRDFVHVKDVTNAISIVLRKSNYSPNFNETFEIGTGVGSSIADFAQLVYKIAGSNAKLNFGAIPDRDQEIPVSVANIGNLKSLGFEPSISLKDGLGMMLTKNQF
jgi:CDP-paratose synthetase